MTDGIEVVKAQLAQVTDFGRDGIGQGLCTNGVLDRGAAMLANVLVGNPVTSPLIEVTLSELSIRVHEQLLMAMTGAAAEVKVNDATIPANIPFSVIPGDVVSIGIPKVGARSYLAVRGSFAMPMFLGSCAPDLVIGFGALLRPGDALRTSVATAPLRHADFELPVMRQPASAILRGVYGLPQTGRVAIPVTPGPDLEQFADESRELYENTYEVSPTSNAMGLRFTGTPPRRTVKTELLSAGVPAGAVEIPGPNEVILLHRARGITAGYAIPAVATSAGLDLLAQLRPGDEITFNQVTVADAIVQRRAFLAEMATFGRRMQTVLAAHGVPIRK